MRHTLYAYWIGQSIGWIVLTLILWSVVGRTVPVTVSSYALSWVLATAIAFWSWRHATRTFEPMPAERGEASALIRYGAPRAPAALLSQALFYTDLAVLAHYYPGRDVSVYAAAIRVAQALVLFLTAVSYMFSPFVADLYERHLHDRLNALFKQVTRWTIGGTIPLLLLFLIAPAAVLKVFGGSYGQGSSWLRILLIGQCVNVSVGAAGLRAHHGGPHRMGSAHLRPVLPDRPHDRACAGAGPRRRGCGDRAVDGARVLQRACACGSCGASCGSSRTTATTRGC